MKKSFGALGVLFVTAIAIAICTYEEPITDPTVMANIEALSDPETSTGWRCVGTQRNNCSASCGLCGTRIPASGKSDGQLTGSHSCSMK